MVAYIDHIHLFYLRANIFLELKPRSPVTPSTCTCTQGLIGYSVRVLSPLVRLTRGLLTWFVIGY